MHLLRVLVFLQTEKTDFAALSYTSTSEIPTLSCTRNLKNVPLSAGASPHMLYIRSTPRVPTTRACSYTSNF